ncbi:MAG TPA: RNA polymerase sigma factor [Anaerolineales bacterium]|nr:RNA polymerase sigma factor [Anaerolineales bacterium]HRQ92585.1 RNA polymerase sigma factor [Anaerolineales bacterium]
MMTEDQQIAAAQRDLAAFDALYLAYAPRVFGYLYSRIGQRAEAEELTAQTFLAALEQLPRYQHKGHFAAWLFAIARHKAADTFRSRPTEMLDSARHISDESDVLHAVAHTQELQALRAQIAALPTEQAELLRLRYVAELSFADMAVMLGRSAGAIKKSVYRCLDRLQRELEVHHV